MWVGGWGAAYGLFRNGDWGGNYLKGSGQCDYKAVWSGSLSFPALGSGVRNFIFCYFVWNNTEWMFVHV